MINSTYVGCETQSTNWPSHGVKILDDGSATWVDGNLGDIQPTTLDYRTYHAAGWTVIASASGTQFVNDRTGHGANVSIQEVQVF